MRILVAEDERITRRTLQKQLESWGHEVVAAEDGAVAWECFSAEPFDIVVTDWEMPNLDGRELIERIRQSDRSGYTYLIMLTAHSDNAALVAGMEAGADDFLAKPFKRNELHVRLSAGERVVRTERALSDNVAQLRASQERIRRDLEAGAEYVRSLIPATTSGPIAIDWRYIPSSDLGGDTIGYHWLDEQHLALYLIDVTGHGLDSALHAVTVTNVVRAGSLSGVDMRKPDQVLSALNNAFQGDRHAQKFFTIWYAVYQPDSRTLTWSGGGHHPSVLLLPGDEHPALLESGGPMMGALEDMTFETDARTLPANARLLIFSDGVFEILRDGRLIWSLEECNEFLASHADDRDLMDALLEYIRTLRSDAQLDDDVSIIEATFE